MAEHLLACRGLEVAYGPVAAVRGLSLQVDDGEIVALLGANGAGKSTTLRGLSGAIRPRAGRVRFRGQRIDRAPSSRIVRLGVAHVPEGRRVFPGLSVADNLELGAWHLARDRVRVERQQELVLDTFPRLAQRRTQLAGSLSGGEQQMLAIGRALMSDPKLLMIDELSLGLAPVVVDELLERLLELHRIGVALLLVEQFVHRAIEVADRLYVLQKGQLSYSGAADQSALDAIDAAYLTEVA